MLAGSLGVLVLALALLAARRRRHGTAQILVAAAAVGVSIALYMRGQHVPAAVLAAIGEGILLFAALRWSNLDLARVSTLTLAMIVFQALLGMWTVSWLVMPIVVMGHLLGGLATVMKKWDVAQKAFEKEKADEEAKPAQPGAPAAPHAHGQTAQKGNQPKHTSFVTPKFNMPRKAGGGGA